MIGFSFCFTVKNEIINRRDIQHFNLCKENVDVSKIFAFETWKQAKLGRISKYMTCNYINEKSQP